jgi:predicted permease
MPLAERLGALTGVQQTSVASTSVFGGRWNLTAWVEGHEDEPGERQKVGYNEIGPGFLATVGIPLLAGREFDQWDRVGSPSVAIVNRAFGRRYFGDADPIGKRFGTRRDDRQRYEIVGVAGNAKVASLRETAWPAVYLSVLQESRTGPAVFHLRALPRAEALAAAVRRAVAKIDADLTVTRIETLEDAIAGTEQRPRLLATAFTLLAVVALFLTIVGLHGTMAYAATRRTGEIGIRMAIGATRSDVLLGMLRETLGIVSIGCALGVALVVGFAPVFGRLLFGVGKVDPPSLAVAVVAAIAAGIAATAGPATRAARTDPATALRHE